MRSSKVLKLIRFIKLVRVMKVSNITVSFKRNYITKFLYKLFKQNQGYFDLLKNMGYIYLLSH